MPSIADKQHAHDLIERLPEEQVVTVVRFLEFLLLDPLAPAVATASSDDEPVPAADVERVRRVETGGKRSIPMSAVLADFGLTMDDFPESPKTIVPPRCASLKESCTLPEPGRVTSAGCMVNSLTCGACGSATTVYCSDWTAGRCEFTEFATDPGLT